jgi:nucleotide-binding universal stress UspA family protein
MRPRTIIVGYDGRGTSDDALVLGVRLAQLAGARLILANACGGGSDAQEPAEGMLRRGLKLVPYGIAAATRAVADGPAARVLEALAEREHADLIVVGSSEGGAVSRVLIGSVGERLLRGAPCAVAVAPRGLRRRDPRSVNQVGVCWDGSAEAQEALHLAIELAREAGADLRLYSAINPLVVAFPMGPVACSLDDESIRAGVERELREVCRRVPDGLLVTGEVLDGEPARMIARQAERDDLDLLVLGSRSRGPVCRVLLGSVSDALMRMAPCSVVIVPRSSVAMHGSPGGDQSGVVRPSASRRASAAAGRSRSRSSSTGWPLGG